MLDAQQDDGSDALTPAQRAAMRRRVRKEVLAERGLDHVPAPKRQLITGSQGTGKTTTAISEIAAGREEVIIWVTEPTRAKAEEVAADYRNIAVRGSPPAKVVYGRSADDPDRPGEAMCPRHVVAQKIAARGLSVRETLCAECPLRETCGFLRQARDIMAMGRCGVFFMARDYLFLPACPAPNPDIIIADEVLTMTAVDEVVEFPPSLLRTVLQCCGGPEEDLVRAGAVLQCLHDALHHPRTLALLRDSGVQTKELTFVKVLLETELKFRRTRFCINGRMSDFAIEAELAKVETGEIGQVLACVKAILKEMPTGRDQLNAVVYDAAQEVMVNGRKERQPRIRVHALRPMRPIKRNTTVLLLDGTGSAMLNRKLFGDTLEHHHLPIERDAHVTGTKGKSYSRQSITGLDSNGRPIHTASSQRLRADIALVAASLPGPGIVGGSKKAVEAIVADGLLPPAAMPAHFGAVRGMNRWEHCESGLCFGRESVSIERLEELARAYAADDPEPFISYVGPPPPDWPYQQWPYHVVRGRRMRNGCVQPVEVEVHPNPLCQEILEQIREAEVLQFIDRPRPIFNRRRLGLMNNLCLDVTYDRILTHAELVAGGTRWDRAWKANGIIPLGAADLHRAHGDLFPSEASAKDALKEARKSGGLAQIEFYLDYPPTFSYRREGQRGSSSKVMVDTMRHPDPRVAVEGVLGPLDKFEQIDSPLSAPMLLPR